MDRGVEIVGPFHRHNLVVDGWSVPLVEAIEVAGGRVQFVVDQRFGFDVSAADFDQASRLVAAAVAVAVGFPCHPRGDSPEELQRLEAHTHIHPALRPRRMVAIGSVTTEEAELPDDPRDEAA